MLNISIEGMSLICDGRVFLFLQQEKSYRRYQYRRVVQVYTIIIGRQFGLVITCILLVVEQHLNIEYRHAFCLVH